LYFGAFGCKTFQHPSFKTNSFLENKESHERERAILLLISIYFSWVLCNGSKSLISGRSQISCKLGINVPHNFQALLVTETLGIL
jgi:hypothetical protein